MKKKLSFIKHLLLTALALPVYLLLGVTPTKCNFTFLGLQTGMTYPIEGYIADVANGNVKFDSGSGASATSDSFWTPPEPVQLRDISIKTGPTVTFKLRLVVNGINMPGLYRYEMHLSTLSYRPSISLGVPAGARFAAVEIID